MLMSASSKFLGGKAFQRPKIVNKPNNALELGVDVKLTCEVLGAYELRWAKNDHLCKNYSYGKLNSPNVYIRETIGMDHFKRRSTTLVIKSFSRHEVGNYSCCAEREIADWVAEDNVRLSLRGK